MSSSGLTGAYDAPSNQGIVEGRPAGQNPEAAPVTLDTYVDKDASADIRPVDDAVHGATSKDVSASLGQPGSGQTSNELHHDGQQGRKRDGQGVSQWGPPGEKNTELDRLQRVTGNDLDAAKSD